MRGVYWTWLSLVVLAGAATDIPVSSNYVLKRTDSCPEVGYYFQRELPAPGVRSLGPCFLCFCQEDNMAACWPRDSSRCDVEKYHHHRIGRNTRVARSPTDLSSIFFRDATRDFFHKQLKKSCEPNVSSFSDGCPPDDWCIGCTVCDCNADGQWDCHVLSFCNPEERKKKIKKKLIMPTRRDYHNGKPKPGNPKKKLKPKNKATAKPKVKPTPKIIKKYISKEENARRKRTNVKQMNTKTTTVIPSSRKPKKRFLQKKRIMATLNPDTVTVKDTDVTDVINAKSADEERKLGEQIVRKVMAAVHRMIQNGKPGRKNQTRVQRSADSKDDCSKAKKTINKKAYYNKKGVKNKKIYRKAKAKINKNKYYSFEQNRYRRKKRAAPDHDLSVIELKHSGIMNKIFLEDNDNNIVDLSVKRIIKNVETTTTDKKGNSTVTVLPVIYTSEINSNTSISLSLLTEDPVISPATDDGMNLKYLNSQDFTPYISTTDTTVELIPVAVKQNTTDLYLNTVSTLKPINISQKAVDNITKDFDKSKDYAITSTDPEYTNFKYKKWAKIKLYRNNIIMNDVLQWYKSINKTESLTEFGNKTHPKGNARKKFDLKSIMANNFETVSSKYFGNQFTVNAMNNNNNSSLHDLLHNLIKELNQNTTPSAIKQKFSLFKYMRKIFRKFSKKDVPYSKHRTSEGYTLQILCENIGACYRNVHNRIAVISKLHDLNEETEKIFRTIKIIKGLLCLIELPDQDTENKLATNKDMQKLESILKDTYNFGKNSNISETTAAQIKYVKQNIRQFVESVSKFASKLNKILDILYKNNNKYGCQRRHRLNEKKKKLDALNKIKRLLVKHNLIENTFVKNMQKLIKDMDNNTLSKTPRPKVSYVDMNNTQIIDKYSKDIIENLRRLQNLTKALNSKRNKRQTMREDDAMEYLLVLMEYLLKKNNPLDTAPVNDGIDLLIDAIQNAPDIKPIKKKVLEHQPTPLPPERTVKVTTKTVNEDLIYFQEDDISDFNRISKEENSSFKRDKNRDMVNNIDHEDEITQIVYYKKFDDDNTTVYNEYDTTTEYAVRMQSEITEKIQQIEKTGFEKFESGIDDTRRYEVFTSDLEDEPIIPLNLNKAVEEPSTTISNIDHTTLIDLKNYMLDDDVPTDKRKTKLDWIEEHFGKEIREYTEQNTVKSKNTAATKVIQTETTAKPVDIKIENISSITVEVQNEKKSSKEAIEEVLYRKQMEFLNSLDYGTESSNIDEADSKDDKYSGDSFPTYFGR